MGALVARLGLRARLVAAFVGIAAIAVLVAALLTGWSLHRSFDDYIARHNADAGRSAVSLAQAAHRAAGGRWTPEGLDILAHELALTGYDYRLRDGGRILLDTTKLNRAGLRFRRVASLPVEGARGRRVATLDLYALGRGGSTPADDELRQELDRGHLIAALIAAAVAIAAGLVVAGRLSRPLRELTVAARGLAAGGRTPPQPRGASPEVRGLAAALDGLAGDLGRQRRSRRRLAQDLSHELRTPLMLLQGRIEAMQDGVVPFDEAGLATLHTETLRLSRLIGQIERLAESEAQPPPLRAVDLPLEQVAREAHAALAAAFEMRGLTLELNAEPAAALADRDAVLQIVTNLLSNALKYAPDGPPVRLSTGVEDGHAVLRVHDAGTGAEVDARVFERFHRGSEAAWHSGGEGLGLTIARDLAELQGGTLDLDAPSAGTTFVLRLPLAHPQAPAGNV